MPNYKICKIISHDFDKSGIGLVKIYFSAKDSDDKSKHFTLYVKNKQSIYDNMIEQIKEWILKVEVIAIQEDEKNTNVVSKIFIGQKEVYCLIQEKNK